MRFKLSVIALATVAILGAALTAGCGAPRQQAVAQPAPTATPGGPPTPFPQYLASTDAGAVGIATDLQANPRDGAFYWGAGKLWNVVSVQWVRSTFRIVNPYFSPIAPGPASGAFPATTWDTPAWVFEFTGDVQSFSRSQPTGGPVGHTLFFVVTPNGPGAYITPGQPLDLSLLAVPTGAGARGPLTPVHTILPGQAPLVDALRAPTPAATGTALPVASTPVPAASATP